MGTHTAGLLDVRILLHSLQLLHLGTADPILEPLCPLMKLCNHNIRCAVVETCACVAYPYLHSYMPKYQIVRIREDNISWLRRYTVLGGGLGCSSVSTTHARIAGPTANGMHSNLVGEPSAVCGDGRNRALSPFGANEGREDKHQASCIMHDQSPRERRLLLQHGSAAPMRLLVWRWELGSA